MRDDKGLADGAVRDRKRLLLLLVVEFDVGRMSGFGQQRCTSRGRHRMGRAGQGRTGLDRTGRTGTGLYGDTRRLHDRSPSCQTSKR